VTTRLAMCEFTTIDTTFEEDVQLAREFGLAAMSICESKLAHGNLEDAYALFAASGLSCSCAVPANLSPLPPIPAGMYPGPEEPDERVELMVSSIQRLAPFRPQTIVFTTGALGSRARNDAENIARDALRTVAREAAAYGMTVSLEPIRSGGYNATWLHSAREALDFIDSVGEPGLQLCVDAYHVWDEPGILDLLRAEGTRVGSVQISDWHEPPRSTGDRLLPGEGSLDLMAMVDALEDGGYQGFYDVEIFSDDGRNGVAIPDSVWAMDPREVYRRSIDGWARVGLGRTGS
jgi:sugar phosphate isomerase/epimerase